MMRNHRPGAVIFDMDGTITLPVLDFDVIWREIGLPNQPRTPVLEALELMDDEQRARAEAILERYETRAAQDSELQEGAVEVVCSLRDRRIKVALLTRNSRHCTEIVLAKHGLKFDFVYTRESGPRKPSPEPVLSICGHFNITPADTWMVGDYLFDIRSGNAAGARTFLMIGDKPEPEYAHEADRVIRGLRELTEGL